MKRRKMFEKANIKLLYNFRNVKFYVTFRKCYFCSSHSIARCVINVMVFMMLGVCFSRSDLSRCYLACLSFMDTSLVINELWCQHFIIRNQQFFFLLHIAFLFFIIFQRLNFFFIHSHSHLMALQWILRHYIAHFLSQCFYLLLCCRLHIPLLLVFFYIFLQTYIRFNKAKKAFNEKWH